MVGSTAAEGEGLGTEPSSGNAKDIVNALNPVKVPISKIFFILENLINKCKQTKGFEI